MIFSDSLSESNDFVLFDLLDGNGALFANVSCNIPILRIANSTLDGNKNLSYSFLFRTTLFHYVMHQMSNFCVNGPFKHELSFSIVNVK